MQVAVAAWYLSQKLFFHITIENTRSRRHAEQIWDFLWIILRRHCWSLNTENKVTLLKRITVRANDVCVKFLARQQLILNFHVAIFYRSPKSFRLNGIKEKCERWSKPIDQGQIAFRSDKPQAQCRLTWFTEYVVHDSSYMSNLETDVHELFLFEKAEHSP